jgi:hypothetical protein
LTALVFSVFTVDDEVDGKEQNFPFLIIC